MSGETILLLVSAAVPAVFGALHLLYTFHGPKLLPRDPGLVEAMKLVPLVLTRETTVWRAWIGFNASHSLSVILFGLVYGYLAVAQPGLLFSSLYLQVLGLLVLGMLTVLARVYWFSAPLIGISVSLVCYVAGLVVAHS
jgi:hypothetical protein